MEERTILLATLSLLTPVKEVLADVIVPSSLSELNEDDKAIISRADELLKCGKPAVTDRKCLQSIFNVLNGNDERMFYQGKILDASNNEINYPTEKEDTDQLKYCQEATAAINTILNEMSLSSAWLNHFYETLESVLTYMPGTLSDPDISLFDQAKLCAAFALCLADSIEER